ncbi:MAG: hypothetical protein ABIH20_02830 [Candidatus Diapherotrites archaeon]
MVNAQISLEVITAVVIVLLMVVVLFLQINNNNIKLDFLETTNSQKAECAELQSFVSMLQTTENAEIQTILNFDVTFTGNTINFDDYFCYFEGNPINQNLVRGTIKIANNEGIISVQNV